jgi:molecular chaperone GrpE
LLRSLAEQENIRTIARRDVDSARQYSIKNFAKSLLEVADNLERAVDHIDAAELPNNPSLNTLYEGISMTSVGLTKALQSNGVRGFCQEPGDPFDPSHHEALMEYADPTRVPGSVGIVMKKGYMLNDRVLRPAEVGVIKK